MSSMRQRVGVLWVLLGLVSVLAGCDRGARPEQPSAPMPTTKQVSTAKQAPATKAMPNKPEAPKLRLEEPGEAAPTRLQAAKRVVAVGDVHGDLAAFEEALVLAGVTDEGGNWAGGDTIFVQTGDLLDRGDDEPEILMLLERLEDQASQAGGTVVVLNGNHETMNVRGDLRYVTPEGFSDFEAIEGLDVDRPGFERVPEDKRARLAAFLPGGPVARLLSHHNMVAIVGDSVFVHGGVLPGHVDYGIERINEETRQWMLGESQPPAFMKDRETLPPNWVRLYSKDSDETACQTLQRVLDELGAKRMVVGHTPQPSGITSACDQKVWRIDVGMSSHYGGTPQALEIRGDEVRVIRRDQPDE